MERGSLTQKAILSELKSRQHAAERQLSAGSASSAPVTWPPVLAASNAFGGTSVQQTWAKPGDDAAAVRHALQVAVQHNFIGVEKQPAPEANNEADEVCRYYAFPHNVLHRLRRSKFALHALSKVGAAAAFIVEEALRQGRVTKRSLLAAAERHLPPGEYNAREYSSALITLIRDGYLMVATNELQRLLQEQQRHRQDDDNNDDDNRRTPQSRRRSAGAGADSAPGSAAGKRKGKPAAAAATTTTTSKNQASPSLVAALGSGSGKSASSVPSSMTPATRAAVTPMMQLYQLQHAQNDTNDQPGGTASGASESDSVKKRKRATAAVEPGAPPSSKKSKRVDSNRTTDDDDVEQAPLVGGGPTSASASDVTLAPALAAAYRDDRTLWAVNPRRFVHEIKKDKFIEFVSDKIDDRAGDILRHLFQYADQTLTSNMDKQSALPQDRTLKRLVDDLAKTEGWEAATDVADLDTRVRAYMDIMAKDKSRIVIHLANPPGYSINSHEMLKQLRNKQLESFIHDKFGAESLRIFRLLNEKSILSDKQIYEMCMIGQAETRQLLYKMLDHGILHLQEVPRTADHNPQRTFYLWSVRHQHVMDMFTDQVYAVVRKMRKRLAAELATHRDLLIKADDEQRRTGGTASLSSFEVAKVDSLRTLQERLHNTILHLDESLILLSDM
jgi:DNA-directed RNA polymerase III subunit RPC3